MGIADRQVAVSASFGKDAFYARPFETRQRVEREQHFDIPALHATDHAGVERERRDG